jgi:hypothetical protein
VATRSSATAGPTAAPAETARIRGGADEFEVAVAEAVPFCHKPALRALAPGEGVRKYGEVIGEATAAVAKGGLVHVHNMASRRARRAGGERGHAG